MWYSECPELTLWWGKEPNSPFVGCLRSLMGELGSKGAGFFAQTGSETSLTLSQTFSVNTVRLVFSLLQIVSRTHCRVTGSHGQRAKV